MAVDVVDKQARTLIALGKMPKKAVELNPKANVMSALGRQKSAKSGRPTA
jgi:hypothetical protein